MKKYIHIKKIRHLFVILIPILITQLTMFSLSFFDTTMSGRISASDLAGVAIGSSLWIPVYTGLGGILMAVTPLVAKHFGAKEHKEVGKILMSGFILAIGVALFVWIVGMVVIHPLLSRMNIEADVFTVASGYLAALGFGLIPLFSYIVIRSFIDGLGRTRLTMIFTLIAVPINIILNFIFIFGYVGAPKLGGIGAGVATTITYWLLCIGAALYVMQSRHFNQYIKAPWKNLVQMHAIWSVLKMGVPIGLAIFFETSIFSAVTLFMSEYSTVTIAAHQAALNFASFLYMLPLSIASAMTIIVGQSVGAKQYGDAKYYSWLGVSVGIVLAIVAGTILLAFRGEIAALYSNDAAVIRLATTFLLYALFFQLSDAIAAPVQGALRGYQDVNVTLMMTLVAYWIIGLPSGYLFAQFTSLGAYGYWVGLILGLAVGATTLSFRLLWIQRHVHHEGVASVDSKHSSSLS